MGVRPGYKQTEVGVIPEDWEVETLGQLGAWKGGATPSMQNPAFWANGTMPWVSSGDVKLVSISDTPMKITDIAVKNSSTTVIPPNSIIVVVRSGILRKYLPVARNTRSLAINQDIKALIPNSNYVPLYFLHLLTWSGPKILATCLKSGTTVESIEFRWLKSFPIPLPPTRAEQEAIAGALSDADDYIEALERLIAKKRLVKQGAMQELLTGQRRLPGFDGEYRAQYLGDIAEIMKGSGLSKAQTSNSGKYHCILYGELFTTYGFIIRNVVSRTNSSDGQPSVLGDILMPGSTTTTGIDLAKASALLVDNVMLGGDINIVRQKSDYYDPVFMASYLTYVKRNEIADITQGITIHHLYGRDLKKLVVYLPAFPEQTAIAAVLSDIDVEIAALEEKLAKARQLKQGMMQELLTGRIRLI